MTGQNRLSRLGIFVVGGLAGLLLLAAAGWLAYGAVVDRAARDAYAEYVREHRAADDGNGVVVGLMDGASDRYRREHGGRTPDADELIGLVAGDPAVAEYVRHRDRARELRGRWGDRWVALGLAVPPAD
jgi:hypothetical protein